MATTKKVETVEQLAERIGRCTIAVSADYLGLSVADMLRLRRALRDSGVDVRVVKNSLFRRAAEQAGRAEIAQLAEGPTAIAFGEGESVVAAKALLEYQRTARNAFKVRMAFSDGQMLTAVDLDDLSKLPPLPVLVAQVAGALISPVARLSGLLAAALTNPPGRLFNHTVRQFAGLLDARAAQLESQPASE